MTIRKSDGVSLAKKTGRSETTDSRGARRHVGREKSGGKSRGVRGRRIDEGRKMATTRKDRARIDARREEGRRMALSVGERECEAAKGRRGRRTDGEGGGGDEGTARGERER